MVDGLENVTVLAGSASQIIGGSIADHLGVPLGTAQTFRFSEGNLFVRVGESVRGRDCFIIQGTAHPANDNFMELMFWIDALKRASADSVTAVVPYFSYAKGDKKDEPRVSIRARVCADALEAAGVDRIVTMDLHSPQVQGFFKVPVDDLRAEVVLCEAIGNGDHTNLVVVSPDAGFAKKARRYAQRLGVPLAIADKRRDAHDESPKVTTLMGDVAGRTALIVDDFTISGGTLIDAARVLLESGASSVCAAVSQAIMTPEGVERLLESPIDLLYTTDAAETQPIEWPDKVQIVSVAPLFADAIRRIATKQSISDLFI